MEAADEANDDGGPDGFAMDDLKGAALAVANESEDADEGEVVPLRGMGWFAPYQQVHLDKVEEYEQQNVEKGLTDGPYLAYCYMCSSWTVKETPHRVAIQGLVRLIDEMSLDYIVDAISIYHFAQVFPRTRKHWDIHMIRVHLTHHVINPVLLVSEHVRGLQNILDGYLENMETVKEVPVNSSEEGAGEDTDSRASAAVRQPPRKKRRRTINRQAAVEYAKFVRLQTSELLTLEKLKNNASGGGGGMGGFGNSSSGGGGGSGGKGCR